MLAGVVSQSGVLTPVITIGGIAAAVAFAGVNGTPGELQFNVMVPSGLANGDQPIVATYSGATTQAGARLTVQN